MSEKLKIVYLDFFKGEIGKTHLAQELWTQIDNGQLAPDLAEIRTSIKHEREHTDIYSSCRLIVKKNGAEIYNRTALDNTLIYSGVIDMPAGHGHMTLEFSVSAWLVNDWYPTASISDLLVVVMKKATAGISIS